LRCFSASIFFSPELNPGVAFIASLFVFWTGFLVRPFGAILFGHLGDLIGRKFTFMLTLGLMGAATFVVGLLPGYDVIGALAPILLVSMRVRFTRPPGSIIPDVVPGSRGSQAPGASASIRSKSSEVSLTARRSPDGAAQSRTSFPNHRPPYSGGNGPGTSYSRPDASL